MTWVRLDDTFPDHPKILQVGPLAELVQVRALCWASRHLTDGFIPDAALPLLLRGIEDATTRGVNAIVEALVFRTIWTRDHQQGGYRIHDFLKYQPSKRDVLKTRNQTRRRVAAWRKRGPASVSNSVSNSVTPVTPLLTHAPSRPVPYPFEQEAKGSNEPLFGATPNATSSNGQPAAIDRRGIRSAATRILEFLNERAGRTYKPVRANLGLIEARLAEGATEADCRGVIARKLRDWKGDPKMAEYVRPKTLFSATNFAQYVGLQQPALESQPTLGLEAP